MEPRCELTLASITFGYILPHLVHKVCAFHQVFCEEHIGIDEAVAVIEVAVKVKHFIPHIIAEGVIQGVGGFIIQHQNPSVILNRHL